MTIKKPVEMKVLFGTVYEEEGGKEVPFRQHLGDMGGSGFIYNEKGCQKILKAALENEHSWADVADYVCPLVDEILLDAHELDRGLYLDIMKKIHLTYLIMKQKEFARNGVGIVELSFKDNDPTIFEKAAAYLKDGYIIDKVTDLRDHTGCWHMDLLREEEDEEVDMPQTQSVMEVTEHERNLISLLRTLCFEDVLDAVDGIEKLKTDVYHKLQEKMAQKDLTSAAGWKERYEALDRLQESLGKANDDYRDHIFPENEDGGSVD
ncbi:hypothetical protein [Paenibacillus sp. GbtcB18]|uniref:hypothetical protein n=1 Tax=Paenibacillus sp. GbtcB18 TaxID=2824763 RepID=UPI001C310BE8|nr:hypothetical protein [Paenibacillus sp. GbtcB18]